MRALYTLLAFFITITTFSQSLIWSAETDVANGLGNLRPRIALTTNNTPVVVWGGGTGTQPVYVSKLNGGTFSTPIAVTPSGVDPYTASWTGPDIAAKGDSVWVVFDTDIGLGFDVYTVTSLNAGSTFGDTINVSGHSGLNRYPSLGSDANGNLAVSYMTHDNGWLNPRYVVSNSLDAGNTWQNSVNASMALTGTEVCDCCPSEIIIDGNNQALLFRNNNANLRDMWATFSADGGQTYPVSGDVDDANWVISACPSSGPDGIFTNNTFYMVWMTAGYGTSKAMITTVDIATAVSTANWGMPGGSSNSQNYPRIAGEGNTIGVAYQEYIASSAGFECFFSYTFSGDTKLDTTVLINEISLASQTNPDVIFADGVFHFVYQNAYTGNVTYRTATVSGVGITEKSNSISIFPNPAVNEITIEGAENTVLQIMNQMGELVWSKKSLNKKETINCSQFAAGTYFVQQIKNKQVIQSEKIIITH